MRNYNGKKTLAKVFNGKSSRAEKNKPMSEKPFASRAVQQQ